jgi:hypothetical protein
MKFNVLDQPSTVFVLPLLHEQGSGIIVGTSFRAELNRAANTVQYLGFAFDGL